MAAPMEILLTSDASGMLWNLCVWDFQTGTAIKSFKGGSSAPRSVCLLDGYFLISAAVGKPIIHVWAAQKKEQQQQRIVCPGVVSCLVASSNNTLCVAGIAEKIHIWQTCTGDLLAVLSRHYQKVTCLCFTDDGSHLISGGEDNLVMVWFVASVLQQGQNSKPCEPLHVWSKHALPITDVKCGTGGSMSRVVSASHDQTCKLWDLASGQLLCNFVFDAPVCSVTMDTAEYHLFAGCSDGNIYQVNLYASSEQRERHIQGAASSADKKDSLIFHGHSKPVTCLSVSMDGTVLASGSQDQTACIWHIHSRQRVRTINHKGAVTNVSFVLSSISNSQTKPNFLLQPFKRHLQSAESDGDASAQGEIGVRIPYQVPTTLGDIDREEKSQLLEAIQQMNDSNQTSHSSRQQLETEIEKLRQANQLLFKSAIELAKT
ncbi:WD repeat-containing protein 18-like [Asterias amurensis]|uniref:WD repeat-containing protein 18-like n=1 Tax=Asterias amurensis TaxID=7602 RepID=UPI003AB64804